MQTIFHLYLYIQSHIIHNWENREGRTEVAKAKSLIKELCFACNKTIVLLVKTEKITAAVDNQTFVKKLKL